MDLSWITDQLAVGGGIWNEAKMMEIVRVGITHIVNMQIEFDDRPLAEPYGVKVLWNPMEDDFQPKSPQALKRGVDFVLKAFNMKRLAAGGGGGYRLPKLEERHMAERRVDMSDGDEVAANEANKLAGSGAAAPVRQLRVVVAAEDFEAALAFYRDALGLPQLAAFEGDGDARVAILDAGRATLELANPAQVAMIDSVEVGRAVSPHRRGREANPRTSPAPQQQAQPPEAVG